MRKQFTFYESFASSISRIRKASDRCVAYDAIVRYALYEEEPDLDQMPDSAAIVFDLIKPTLDSSKRKAESGQKGGKAEASPKQTGSEGKPEANGKQNGSKPEANGKQTGSEKENEKEGEKEIEKENECSISPLTPQKRKQMIDEALPDASMVLKTAVEDWLKYKTEKRQPYKQTGLRALLTQIRNGAEKYGEARMVDVIYKSAGANYQGIVFDWLNKPAAADAAVMKRYAQYTTAAQYKAPAQKKTVAELQGLVDKI